jgi:SAM-dependent methyltransferase
MEYESDREQARRTASECAGMPAEWIVRHIYSSRPGWTEADVTLRVRQVMSAPARLRRELQEWLRPCLPDDGVFLDLGCGPGMLIAAAAGRRAIGVDVSLTWLVAARQLKLEAGSEPVLAAAAAEALPLPDQSVDSIVSLDVIEHVADPEPYLREIDRVAKRGGHIALSTPNRFSLTAEPHVRLWGVGWLPRPLQKRYVEWHGKNYDFIRLLDSRERRRILRNNTSFDCRILIPRVAQEEIAHFPRYRARLATLYNGLVASRWTRWPFLGFGPFFHVVGTKR